MGTLSDFASRLRFGMRTRVPTFVWGLPGIGKTYCIESMAAEEGMLVYTLIGSTCDPTDINGMPVMVANGTDSETGKPRYELDYAPRSWIPRLNAHRKGGVLFVDEYTNTPADVRAALLRGLQHGIFGDTRLDLSNTAIIAAGNPPDVAANGQELDPPTANRFTHLQYPTGPDAAREWTEQFPSYWGNPPVLSFRGQVVGQEPLLRARSAVAGFVRRKSELWHQMPTEASKRSSAWPSPRSWDAASRYLGTALHDDKDYVDVFPLIAGCVGEGAAGEFLVYVRECSLPDPEVVLANADTYTPTGRVDVDFSVLMAVAAAVTANLTPDRYIAAWRIVSERALAKRDGKVPAYESATAAARALGDLMRTRSGDISGKVPASQRNKFSTELGKLIHKFSAEFGKFMTFAETLTKGS